MLVKVESVAGAIEISVVTVYWTSCTSEKKPCTVSPMSIMTTVKTALKGQPLSHVQPQVGEGSPTFCRVSWLREIVPLWKLWWFCPGKMWRGAGWTALQSTHPLLSPGTPSSRTVQAWLDKIHKGGWGVHVCGVQVCGRPSQ